MTIPFEAAVAQLVRQGFSRDVAEREVNRQIVGRIGVHGSATVLVEKTAEDSPPIAWPLRIALPWSHLISDNRKYTARLINKAGRLTPQLCLTDEYRTAKERMRKVARASVAGAAAVAFPLELHALVWVPDNRPGHDVANFAKCCHDALEGVVYTSDQWLHRVTWERAGVDVDGPRAELVIQPFTAEPR